MVGGVDEPADVAVVLPVAKAIAEGDDDADVGARWEQPVSAVSSAAPLVADEEEDVVDPLAGLPLRGIDARWRTFVALLQQQRAGEFRLARLKAIADDVIDVGAPSEWGVAQLTRFAAEGATLLVLERAFGRPMRLVVHREETGGVSIHEAEEELRRELQTRLEAHARAHPLVQKAVALFGGELRAVRRQ